MLTLSQISFVNAQSGLLADLLPDTVPNWREYHAAIDRCNEKRAELLAAPQQGTESLIDSQVAALLRGEPLSADLGEVVEQALAANTRREGSLRVVEQMINRFFADRDEAVRQAETAILAALDTRLQVIVNKAQGLKLKDAIDADQALDAGVIDDWSKFAKLRVEYVKLRDAQASVVQAFSIANSRELDTFGYFRDYATLLPEWREWRPPGIAGGATFDPHHGVVEHRYVSAPWPHDAAGRLRWLVDHPDVKVWIPTRSQLNTAMREAEAVYPPAPAEEFKSSPHMNIRHR